MKKRQLLCIYNGILNERQRFAASYIFIYMFSLQCIFCDDAWCGIMIHENKSNQILFTLWRSNFEHCFEMILGMIRYLTSRWRFKIKLIFITEDVFSLFVSLPNVYHACITKLVLTFSRWVSLRIKDGGYPLIFPCKL